MDKWQECTTRAITEFRLRYYGNSILLHQQALDIARYEFPRQAKASAERAISKVVISCFNIADCYIALDEIDRAGDFYLSAQHFLLEAGGEMGAEDELAGATGHALGHINMMWADFLKKYRDRIVNDKLMQYHENLQLLTNRELTLSVCH